MSARRLKAFLPLVGALLAAEPCSAAVRSGETVYGSECAGCHDSGASHAPTRATLAAMPTAAIVRALEVGVMRVVGTFNLNGPERVAVAEYVAGKPYDANWNMQTVHLCSTAPPSVPASASAAQWNGWGNGPHNLRFQDAVQAGLTRADIGALQLQWAFAFPGETIAEAQPTVVGGRLFVGSRSGAVYALDARSACVHWTFQADGPVKNSVLLGEFETGNTSRQLAFFGDLNGNAYAVDALDGTLVWRRKVDPFPSSALTGSFMLAAGKLLVPVTANESTAAAAIDASCCVFRGSVVALDPLTGAERWRRHTIDEEPRKTGENARGNAVYGPAGATIWAAPTFDEEQGVAYVGTGENSSGPATTTSDAILAVDINTSERKWSYQGYAGDAWNMSCGTADKVNCPKNPGPDYDMGSSPILVTLASGKRVLLAAQKSGLVHALDPDRQGTLLWKRQLAKGGVLGGIEWGPASDGRRVYVAIADMRWASSDLLDPKLAVDAHAGGGVVALDLEDGNVVWQAPAVDCAQRPGCSPAQTAAVTAIPGVVFAGSMSGHLRAFDSESGAVLWTYDTVRDFETVNGAKGRGGALDASGPVVVDGWVYVVSGYSKWGGLPGNVLLAFAPPRARSRDSKP